MKRELGIGILFALWLASIALLFTAIVANTGYLPPRDAWLDKFVLGAPVMWLGVLCVTATTFAVILAEKRLNSSDRERLLIPLAPSGRLVIVISALVLLLALLTRLDRIAVYPWGIEADESLWTVQSYFTYISPESSPWHWAPTYYSVPLRLIAAWLELTEPTFIQTRVLAALLSSLSALLTFLIVYRLFNLRTALIATLLMLFSAYDTMASRSGLGGVFTRAFVVATYFALLFGLLSSRWYVVSFAGLLCGLTMLNYNTGYVSVVVCSLWIVANRWFADRRGAKPQTLRVGARLRQCGLYLAAFAIPVLPFAPTALAGLKLMLNVNATTNSARAIVSPDASQQLGALAQIFGERIGRLAKVTSLAFDFQSTDMLLGYVGPAFNQVVMVAALCGLCVCLLRLNRFPYFVVLTWWLAQFVGIPIATGLIAPRAFLTGSPALFILAAIGLVFVGDMLLFLVARTWKLRYAKIVCVSLVAVMIGIFGAIIAREFVVTWQFAGLHSYYLSSLREVTEFVRAASADASKIAYGFQPRAQLTEFQLRFLARTSNLQPAGAGDENFAFSDLNRLATDATKLSDEPLTVLTPKSGASIAFGNKLSTLADVKVISKQLSFHDAIFVTSIATGAAVEPSFSFDPASRHTSMPVALPIVGRSLAPLFEMPSPLLSYVAIFIASLLGMAMLVRTVVVLRRVVPTTETHVLPQIEQRQPVSHAPPSRTTLPTPASRRRIAVVLAAGVGVVVAAAIGASILSRHVNFEARTNAAGLTASRARPPVTLPPDELSELPTNQSSAPANDVPLDVTIEPDASPLVTSSVRYLGQTVSVRHSALDRGTIEALFDNDLSSPMKGENDNPFLLQFKFEKPVELATIWMALGQMQDYTVMAQIKSPDGREISVKNRYRTRGADVPYPLLTIPNGPQLASELLLEVKFEGVRPAGDIKVHIFEVRLR